MKQIIILLVLFLASCVSEEAHEKTTVNFKVDGELQGSNALVYDEELLLPLRDLLDNLEITYEMEENYFSFPHVKINYDEKEAIIDEAEVTSIVLKKQGEELFVSLDFLLDYLEFDYVRSDEKINIEINNQLLKHYSEALEIFSLGMSATIIDVQTGKTFEVVRTFDMENTRAYVETKTSKDTEILYAINDHEWNHIRRSVVVDVDGKLMAGSLTPHPCSGRSDRPAGNFVDNRSGHTGAGINYDFIKDNDMEGILHIGFYNSLVPGIQRIDEVDQKAVLNATYQY